MIGSWNLTLGPILHCSASPFCPFSAMFLMLMGQSDPDASEIRTYIWVACSLARFLRAARSLAWMLTGKWETLFWLSVLLNYIEVVWDDPCPSIHRTSSLLFVLSKTREIKAKLVHRLFRIRYRGAILFLVLRRIVFFLSLNRCVYM